MSLKAAIARRARELGFDDCRFTTATAPGSAQKFEDWLAQGQHGEMAYLKRNAHQRVDPQQVLPGAKSIVTLAVSYALPNPEPGTCEVPTPQFNVGLPAVALAEAGSSTLEVRRSEPRRDTKWRPQSRITHLSAVALAKGDHASPSGLIARYAQYVDYHSVIGQRLASLSHFVDQLGAQGTRSLWYIDTGPLLERDLAQRAGLGFIGKHTNLISRRFGNWIFLCEMLTTLELEPDAPERNYCGSCSRCIAACPTAAIRAPFQLDARRCISYLTIELKGPIPVELRPAIGNRIYGCDDCLAACPWNRFAREGEMMKAHARREVGTLDLLELLSLSEPAFKARFAGTPMLRARRRGLLRNACVALGNLGDERSLPALDRAARDPELLIAEHARWAIERITQRAVLSGVCSAA